MRKIYFLIKFLFIVLFITSNGFAATSNHFTKGKKFFDNKEYDKSKIFFERDIVYNPKSEKSYLYLAKIFKEKKKDEEEEHNLNNVLLLNPKNDEAIYLLTLLKIKQSNYNEAKDLIERFTLVCNTFCSKKKEVQEKFEKLIPENAKSNN
tara:strand:+ start:1745 stop:2194 length:450 start_codon:yes stop_codon:yes gene_type:complete